ncbi:DUF2505 domain-containing protein [Nakamurella leprariae]|uniref:DUF2505 domain-containing protein n=1 Tax=Nakamurella leprariae TaxID=2803911 RepID=A0A939BVH9_9ACTN|nr:DUF2505 domain-containing protein [Nakamurella leprariae]MBM9466538.1 DUF2505 domain-containing protein [Nakamurella leprariae]
MPTPLSLTASLPVAPGTLFAKLGDREFVTGRLLASGGDHPEVVTVDPGPDSVKIVTRQRVPEDMLPSMIRSFLPSAPVIERTEQWRADGDGYLADLDVSVSGAPAGMTGTMELRPDGSGSTYTVTAQATVSVPLFGSKVEQMIVEQVQGILRREEEFFRSAV